MMGASAFASAQGFRDQRWSHQNQYQSQYRGRDQHFSRDRYNGVQYRYPVYDNARRWRDRDDRWRFQDRYDSGRHEYGNRR
jgi:hypothetical protein